MIQLTSTPTDSTNLVVVLLQSRYENQVNGELMHNQSKVKFLRITKRVNKEIYQNPLSSTT